MKPDPNRQLKWELTRERFGIEDRFPTPARRTEKRIGDILRKITGEDITWTEPLPKALTESWSAIAGLQLAKHTSPVHIRNGILYVYADHPGWLSELKRLPKSYLLKRIGSVQKHPEIKDIRFQIDPAIRTQKSRPSPAGRNPAKKAKKETGEP
jgi:hypothetical protein